MLSVSWVFSSQRLSRRTCTVCVLSLPGSCLQAYPVHSSEMLGSWFKPFFFLTFCAMMTPHKSNLVWLSFLRNKEMWVSFTYLWLQLPIQSVSGFPQSLITGSGQKPLLLLPHLWVSARVNSCCSDSVLLCKNDSFLQGSTQSIHLFWALSSPKRGRKADLLPSPVVSLCASARILTWNGNLISISFRRGSWKRRCSCKESGHRRSKCLRLQSS